jgi:hypothetical protein
MSSQSIWTRFLRKEEVDPYAHYHDQVNMRCHEIISQSIHDLQQEHPQGNAEAIRKMAINMVMAQMLEIQFQMAPDSQAAMVASLLEDLPQMHDFRMTFVGDIQKRVLEDYCAKQSQQEHSFLNTIKKIFKP